MQQTNIGFIGSGLLSTSLITGMLSNAYPGHRLLMSQTDWDQIRDHVGFNLQVVADYAELIKLSKVIVLGAKPPQIRQWLDEHREALAFAQPLIIIMTPGLTTQHIHKWVDKKLPVLKATPNLPVILAQGATGLYASPEVSSTQKDFSESLFRTVGLTIWVSLETDMKLLTALSTTGPAHLFSYLQSFAKGAEDLGLSNESAQLLIIQTALGAARMAMESNLNLEDLLTQCIKSSGMAKHTLADLENHNLLGMFKSLLESSSEICQILEQEFDILPIP